MTVRLNHECLNKLGQMVIIEFVQLNHYKDMKEVVMMNLLGISSNITHQSF